MNREEAIQIIQEHLGATRAQAELALDRYVVPELLAGAMRERGADVVLARVHQDLSKPGVVVRCSGCGQSAKMVVAPPEDARIMCPKCQAEALERDL